MRRALRGGACVSDAGDRRMAGTARRGIAARRGKLFSREKLERVGDYIRNEIATGKIPGAVMLIQQHGQPVYFESFGVRDVETKLPMTRGYHLPAVFDVEADHVGRGHDAGRGRQARARRSRFEIHSGLCRREGRRRKHG